MSLASKRGMTRSREMHGPQASLEKVVSRMPKRPKNRDEVAPSLLIPTKKFSAGFDWGTQVQTSHFCAFDTSSGFLYVSEW